MVMVRNATAKDIPALSRKLLQLLNNKNSKVYQDNITKFGIPEEYVRKAFAEETLLKAVESEKATFYLALEDEEIIGFAQTIQQDVSTTELDRIIIFRGSCEKGHRHSTA